MHGTFMVVCLAYLGVTLSAPLQLPNHNAELQLLKDGASSCVLNAQRTCDDLIDKGNDIFCIDPKRTGVTWWDLKAPNFSQCFCHKKEVGKKWWDCFYRQVMPCTEVEKDLYGIFYMEWYWRENRRTYCQDDWKPRPPWDVENKIMPEHYLRDRENQYMWDFEDKK